MTPKILVIDDEEPVRLLHGRLLKRLGCWCAMAGDAAQARSLLQEHEFALALIDVNMPGVSCVDLVRHIATQHPDTAMLMVTAVDDPLIADTLLELGAYGYLVKPFECNELLINVSSALRRRTVEIQNRKHRERLEELILVGSSTLYDSLARLKHTGPKVSPADQQLIFEMARIAEFRAHDPGRHLENVSNHCAIMARRLGSDAEYCELFRLASVLHDIGKIVIPEGTLLKQDRLNRFEFEMVKRHCTFAHLMLTGTESPLLALADSIAWTHHERYDGTGYPRGLAGDAIPIEGRIVAIADVFDALTTGRAYRPAYPAAKAIDLMQQNRGQHFDSNLLDLFFQCIQEADEIQAA
jgi:putative two-component system response regulator